MEQNFISIGIHASADHEYKTQVFESCGRTLGTVVLGPQATFYGEAEQLVDLAYAAYAAAAAIVAYEEAKRGEAA